MSKGNEGTYTTLVRLQECSWREKAEPVYEALDAHEAQE
jgi:hypothetical protein